MTPSQDKTPGKRREDFRERRRHQRLPVVEGMVEPITIGFGGTQGKRSASGKDAQQPAILTNLSAGGLSLITFLEPPRARRLEMVLLLPGLNHVPVEGKVVRVHEKGQTFNVGIAFTKISKKHRERINAMAQDHMDCETRIALKLPEVCVSTCSFHALCAKPQKGPFWRKK